MKTFLAIALLAVSTQVEATNQYADLVYINKWELVPTKIVKANSVLLNDMSRTTKFDNVEEIKIQCLSISHCEYNGIRFVNKQEVIDNVVKGVYGEFYKEESSLPLGQNLVSVVLTFGVATQVNYTYTFNTEKFNYALKEATK